MSERRGFMIRNGFLAAGALSILLLLVLFYSTVTGAVDRATHRRAETVDNARLSATKPSTPRLVVLTASTR